MKVFLSWSGNPSREIAQAFNEWLPSVLQAVRPYFSPEGIEKGTRWPIEIAQELDACDLGLLFLTTNNLQAPWIMFEAGALSKKLDRGRVSPLLFEVGTTDMEGPLVQFQATRFNRDDIWKMIEDLNRCLREQALTDGVLANTFEKWWPELEQQVSKILQRKPDNEPENIRSERDLLEETLQIVRSLSNQPSLFPGSSRAIYNLKSVITQTEHTVARFMMASLDFDLPEEVSEQIEVLRAQVTTLKNIITNDIPVEDPPRRGRLIRNIEEFRELWPAALVRIKKRIGITAVAYLHHAKPAEFNEEEAVLEYEKEFHWEKAQGAMERLPIEEVLNECFASRRRVRLIWSGQVRDEEL